MVSQCVDLFIIFDGGAYPNQIPTLWQKENIGSIFPELPT